MTNDSTPQKQIIDGWTNIYQGTSEALAWIDRVRATAPRLDSEADDLKLQFYRAKNLANSLRRVAGTPMTVGFFGLSQAGKSYLISALAADSDGQLLTKLGNEKLNFITHVNPTGLGKEATGLVTRFSRLAQESPDPDFPVELALFKEIEIAMILANAWLNDFDQELIGYEINEDLIQSHLQPFLNLGEGAIQAGVAPEDIVALGDYVGDKRSVAKLKHVYWPKILDLAPRLNLNQRAQLFSILWGKQPRITDTYIQLAQALHQLGLATKVYAPLSVLVQKTASGYEQKNSIMNVDTLNLLGTPTDSAVHVRPCINNELLEPVAIHTAQLTALTSEMTFALAAPPRDPVVEKVDLLDFPGYRARLKMPTLGPLNEQKDIIPQLLLRGKVAYLFERYTNSQEMNALIMCTNSTKQSEVVDVDQVLGEWIHKTQGATPKDRAKRQSGLLWAMTMMDNFVKDASEVDSSQRPVSCANLLHITMLERFGKSDWMQNWDGKPFGNAYLVRKPRLRTTFLQLDNQQSETAVMPSALAALDELRHSFTTNEAIQKHVNNPAEAWDGLMTLNDGGITRLGQGIANVADPSFKLERIREQLDEIREQVKNDLGQWYHQDADDAEGIQKAKAQLIIPSLSQVGQHIGELMHLLSLDDTSVRNLYLSGAYDAPHSDKKPGDAGGNTSSTNRNAAIDLSSLGLDLDFSTPNTENSHTDSIAASPSSHEHLFATAVFSTWTAHLRTLSRKDSPLQQLGIPNFEQVAPVLIEELITASARKNLATEIQNQVVKRAQSGVRREQLAQRYVLITQLAIQDFIAHLGLIRTSPESRPQVQNKPVFDFHPPLASGELPTLPDQATPPYRQFSQHWLVSLYNTIIENAGHSAGREITVAENSELGAVLKKFGIV